MHEHRDAESYSHKHTDEIKQLIGIKSRNKFTPEYKSRQRKQYEEKGYWVPLNQKDDYIFYRDCANWNQRMFDIVKDTKNKLSNCGVFNNTTNIDGVVRDHIYSRRTGFQNKVFPEILRHPCNCQILTHSENVSKKKGRYTDADGMTLDQLFDKILSFKKEWQEQQLCVILIDRYKRGERYNKEEYINKYYESTI